MTTRNARIFFIEMMGVPGSFDASVYNHLDDKEDEGAWFVKRFGHMESVSIATRNVCIGESLPGIAEVDGLVLAGTYNSVHDHTDWQQRVRAWLPQMRTHKIPILGICGAHQMIAHMAGSAVDRLRDGPCAGTLPVTLTAAGAASPLFQGIAEHDCFHFANGEQVIEVPSAASLLASSSQVPVAALDYGDHCYTTQFHPEGSELTLGPIWQYTRPQLMQNYHADDRGDRLVENFLGLVVDQLTCATTDLNFVNR
jgi:GMP synthase (glutamine-hydrolysing)